MTKEQTNSWVEDFRNIYTIKVRYNPKEPLYGDENVKERTTIEEFISKTISQEKEKMIDEIKKIEMPEYQNEGAEHANAGYVRAVEDIINLLQNK